MLNCSTWKYIKNFKFIFKITHEKNIRKLICGKKIFGLKISKFRLSNNVLKTHVQTIEKQYSTIKYSNKINLIIASFHYEMYIELQRIIIHINILFLDDAINIKII